MLRCRLLGLKGVGLALAVLLGVMFGASLQAETQAEPRVTSKDRWAVVIDGTLASGQGVNSSTHFGNGGYEVLFDRDVIECVYIVSMHPGSGATKSGQADTAARAGTLNGVFIQTRDSSGVGSPRAFTLFVGCE